MAQFAREIIRPLAGNKHGRVVAVNKLSSRKLKFFSKLGRVNNLRSLIVRTDLLFVYRVTLKTVRFIRIIVINFL